MSMFPSRRQEARNHRARVALALIALVLAICVLVAWLATRYYLSGAAERPENSDPSSLPVETLPAETATSLLILGDTGKERFLLVQFAPASGQAYVAAVPAAMDDGTGQAIAATLQKSGCPQVKQSVQTALGLPLSHYIAVNTVGVEKYMNYLESGVSLTLPEAVSYTDDSGLTLRLVAGLRQLTAGQLGLLLRYDGWSSPAVGDTVAAELVTALLNRYLQPEHRFDGDFAALANVVQTDIRIDHYNAYRTTLLELANANTGTLAKTVTLTGTTENDLFHPDVATLRKQSPLYDQPEGDNG